MVKGEILIKTSTAQGTQLAVGHRQRHESMGTSKLASGPARNIDVLTASSSTTQQSLSESLDSWKFRSLTRSLIDRYFISLPDSKQPFSVRRSDLHI